MPDPKSWTTPDGRAELRREHVAWDRFPSECYHCGDKLPCPPLQLLAALEEAERGINVLRAGRTATGTMLLVRDRDDHRERAEAAEALVRRLGKSLLCLNTSHDCSVRAARLAKWNAPICDCWPCILYASIPPALREEGT